MHVLYFFRDNTPECQFTRQNLLRYLDNQGIEISVQEINFDTDKMDCEKYRVYGVPTIILLHDDEIISRYSGLLDVHELKNIFGTFKSDVKINLNTTKKLE
jgi:thioredoxin-like negative regulator of GroEL